MTSAVCCPAVQFEALIVSVCAGVSVNTVPELKLMATVEPAVSDEVPSPPSVIGTAATVVAHEPDEVVTLPVNAGCSVQGSTLYACVARLTTVLDPSRNAPSTASASSANCCLRVHTERPQYQRHHSVVFVGGAVRYVIVAP